MEILKTVCIDAEKNDILITPCSKTIQHFRESDYDRYIQTLSFDELEQIRTFIIPSDPVLRQFKKENTTLAKNISLTNKTIDNVRKWILIGREIGQRGAICQTSNPKIYGLRIVIIIWISYNRKQKECDCTDNSTPRD